MKKNRRKKAQLEAKKRNRINSRWIGAALGKTQNPYYGNKLYDKSMEKGNYLKFTPKEDLEPKVIEDDGVDRSGLWTVIYSDGGSASNVPPYGEGYGSYKIGRDGKIVTTYFGRAMSSNSAEILSIVTGIKAAKSNKLHILSDSKTGISWANSPFKPFKDTISEEMKNSIIELRKAIGNKQVKGSYRPREQMFAIFGH